MPGSGRRRRGRSGRRGREGGSSPAIASTSPATTCPPSRAPAPTPSMALLQPAQLHRLPDRVSFAQGAALGVPYGTAYRALFIRAQRQAGRNRPRPRRDRRRRHRGRAARARARHERDRHAAAPTAACRPFANNGADVVVNHREPDYLDADHAGDRRQGRRRRSSRWPRTSISTRTLGLLAKHGRDRRHRQPRARRDRRAAGDGARRRDPRHDALQRRPPPTRSIHAALVAGLANGTLNPLVGREIPLADAPTAHEAVMEPGALGKIVLVP